MSATCNKFGLLFGSLVVISFAISAITVAGILIHHNSRVLLQALAR